MIGSNINVSFLRPKQFAASAAAASSTVQVPRGEKAQTFIAYGAQRVPALTLSGPGGVRIASATPAQEVVRTSQYTAMTLDGLHETAITVRHPASGTWTITPQGTEPITELRAATEVTMPTYRASLRRLPHGKLLLKYRVNGGSSGLVIQSRERQRL